MYPIERVNLVTGEFFKDQEHIVYVNAQYKGEDPLGDLMHDFLSDDPNAMKCAPVARSARYYKENERGVDVMCRIMEEMCDEARKMGQAEGRSEGRAEGRLEGRAEGQIESLIRAVVSIKQSLGLSDDQAWAALQITPEDWGVIAGRV